MASGKNWRDCNDVKYRKYKIGDTLITNNMCDFCMCKHSILTCEKYKKTIPKSVLRGENSCKYFRINKDMYAKQ